MMEELPPPLMFERDMQLLLQGREFPNLQNIECVNVVMHATTEPKEKRCFRRLFFGEKGAPITNIQSVITRTGNPLKVQMVYS